ncbi:MAG: 3'-5' exonuclease [Tissierellia bacterium]|nr:3'-5' exonuclease [Tissierellia bacterium]
MKLDELNEKQREAVEYNEGPLLILAGAGSGKTRVLTTKIGYILEQGLASRWEILAITFTNKAANEMKERVEKILGEDVSSMWIGTFHSICVRILRQEITHLGYDAQFTIYDRTDQKSLVKEIIKEKGVDLKSVNPSEILNTISRMKNHNIKPKDLDFDLCREYGIDFDSADYFDDYQGKLKEYNALDFDDLIIKTIELFQKNEDILDKYASRFKYVFVDEYQDTNHAQYELVHLLSKVHRKLCVVGDADQSIYGWRGADISNINDFEKDYKDAKIVLLEQNYRSTESILNAANAVIKNNPNRKDKNLWTANKGGEKVSYRQFSSDYDEAYGIINEISNLLIHNVDLNDVAILYRTNAQSRPFEEQMLKEGIPYQVVGGLKFYDRKEVKDVLAYLRVIVNPRDNVSLLRIINTPKRGIGDRTVEQTLEAAENNGMSILEYITETSMEELTPAAQKKMKEFADLYQRLQKDPGEDLVTRVEYILDESGYVDSLKESGKREDQTRWENISAFVDAVAEYNMRNPEAKLEEYLQETSLLSDVDKTSGDEGVSLMTVHSAKGLEFDVVFIAGMEEGLFPHRNSVSEKEKEEERRLCYVAITRAGKQLFISSSSARRTFGKYEPAMESPFIDEMREHLEEKEKKKAEINFRQSYSDSMNFMKDSVLQSFPKSPKKKESSGFQLGEKVKHKKFGVGTIVQVTPKENGDEVTISFENKGIKKLNAGIAPLERI